MRRKSNKDIRKEYRDSLCEGKTPINPPQIVLEAYCDTEDSM